MTLPIGFVQALKRRHDGKEHTKEEIDSTFRHIAELYRRNLKARERLDKLWKYWDDEDIESYFEEPKWYNAHSRRQKLEDEIKSTHRQMFMLLTYFDGNYGEEFSQFHCISADEIFEDFKGKYKPKI